MRGESIVHRLIAANQRVVFAESCTGGALAAELSSVPGASAVFCGSAVTYRQATKQAWIDVRPETLGQHSAESAETTREMALGVLKRTPEADYAIAVTGHYGPNAPPSLDGVVFVCIGQRTGIELVVCCEHRWPLVSIERPSRRQETVERVLELFGNLL